MAILDKLLILRSIEDLTETTWWADTVFRAFERDNAGEQGSVSEVVSAPRQLPTEFS